MLGSSTRSKILVWFFAHPGERFYVRQLQAILGSDLAIVSRELRNLESIGILRSERVGKERVYSLSIAREGIKRINSFFSSYPEEVASDYLKRTKEVVQWLKQDSRLKES